MFMQPSSTFHNKLLKKNFVFTAETTPPDSSDKNVLLKKISSLKDIADAINVTDSPGANVHMSSLVASIILAQNSFEPILQFTVRDRNRLALQGDLLGAAALGVHNILCLSGDDPSNGDQPQTKSVNDIDSLGLVSTANMMKDKSQFPSGRKIDPPPYFFIGGAEVPTEGKPDPKKIKTKIDNGVNFFQTQYVFDHIVLKEYMKILEDEGIFEKAFFIIGLGPFSSAKSAKWMNDNLFGVNVPDKIINRLNQSKDPLDESMKICLELIDLFKGINGVNGVHLMGPNKENIIEEIIKNSKKN